MKRLDDQIRAAFEALEESVPDGYFDEFASRVDTRLEEQAMNGTDMSDVNGDRDREMPPMTAEDAESKDTWEDDEHSGLAEITELASKTKSRISRRATTQSEAESAMLLSASHSGLSQVVLPEPGKGKQKFDDAEEAVAKSTTKGKSKALASAVAAAGGEVEETRGGMPVWVYGAVGIVAAAAVVFFFIRGGKSDSSKDNKPALAKTDKDMANAGANANAPTPPAAAPGNKSGATPPVVADDSKKDSDGTNTADPDKTDPAADGKPSDDATADKDNKDDSPKVATNATAKRTKTVARRNAPRTAKNTRARARKSPVATPKKTPKKTTRRGKKKAESVEDLLGQFDQNKGKKKVVKKVAAKPTKKSLSRSDIRRGMGGVSSRVQGCYNAHKKSGLVMISVKITGAGKVSASPTGSFAGTPTGKCVASAVRLARFPKFSGAPMSFPYPFRLNP